MTDSLSGNRESVKMRRPRGGQVWRRRTDGQEVTIQHRRSNIDPLASTRPGGSGINWSLVLWTIDRDHGGVTHEEDFCQEFEFIRGRSA